MKSRPTALPQALPAKHLLPPNQPWAAQNQKSVFDGGMTANARAEEDEHLPPGANQSAKSALKVGEGTDPGPEKTPADVPWANAEKRATWDLSTGL